VFTRLVREIDIVRSLPPKYRARIRAEDEFMELLRLAQAAHDKVTGSDDRHGRVAPAEVPAIDDVR
jgi:hypothetical protein